MEKILPRRSPLLAWVLAVLVIAMVSAAPVYAADKEGFQFRKEPGLQQIKPKKPVKIRLKRTAKEEYSWELTGDDVDEIIKTDKKLRKLLNMN